VGPERARLALRFDPNEIHLFTERIKPGEACSPGLLVRRVDRGGGEERRFDVRRARLLEQIVSSVENVDFWLPAKTRGGYALYGPRVSKSEHLCVVLEPAGRTLDGRTVFAVRTSYTVSKGKFAKDKGSRTATNPPFPPPKK
jgi:hypothetical protein